MELVAELAELVEIALLARVLQGLHAQRALLEMAELQRADLGRRDPRAVALELGADAVDLGDVLRVHALTHAAARAQLDVALVLELAQGLRIGVRLTPIRSLSSPRAAAFRRDRCLR